ncbi:MAG: adenylate/guanylate cyclase domain-containing protein [Bacteroidia bacterium]|nr:adenylate/guanylate cyclase domain-containing protein [Bacteroidia bacterium]
MDKNFAILYVDDEPQNLISFRATFRREYKIFTASSGEDGLEMLRQNEIHLIITDERMPGMTGVQFLEKTIPQYPECVRIVLTGFTDMEAIIRVINNGKIFRYITKPWDENELRMTIENARQLHELQQNNKRLVRELQTKVEEQERTLKLFMKYVPESVVEKALSNTTDSIFEGELREIAVLFCDIRGFTTMSEELSPKEVVAFLNDYYAMMSSVIKRYEGTVNQFVGDEIFAAFGTPIVTAHFEQSAVFCALDMMKKLEELNARYREKMGREIEMGIGINSGEVVAGNLGSEDKISYSVTGDTVNTGKRIETLTKDAPNTILISDRIYRKVHHLIEASAWDPIEVKGKREKIQVYEVKSRR